MAAQHELDIRATAPEEWRAACDTMRAALLNGPVADDDWEQAIPGWEDQISFTAWDGVRCVGHAGAFRFDTIVPGGARLATAGVTRVGVLPTATRQGVLTRMLREVLCAARAEGRPLASLRASEAVIYRRFGFGIAADSVGVSVDTRRARPLANVASGSVRLLSRDEILATVAPIYERAATRPGVISRPPHLTKRYLADALTGSKGSFVAVHTSVEGIEDGYVHYSVSWSEELNEEHYGIGEVHDLWGVSPDVELALWSHLLSIDLVRRYDVEERPLDDVLRLAVADPRSYQTKHRFDEQWVRLLDVEACLEGRTYRSGASVAIAVNDPLFEDNTDVFEVTGAGVRRLGRSASADIRCEIDSISAAYFGAVSWWELAAAGRVSADRAAIARADDLFACRPLAWCGSFF
jgi:predicted acetyltransferase